MLYRRGCRVDQGNFLAAPGKSCKTEGETTAREMRRYDIVRYVLENATPFVPKLTRSEKVSSGFNFCDFLGFVMDRIASGMRIFHRSGNHLGTNSSAIQSSLYL
jgi:hypothetical protein